ANEEAVAYFLRDEIKFLQIGELVQSAMQNIPNGQIHDYEDVLHADLQAREFVRKQIQKGAIL
ncbi:MAG: 1-deoxy-D-xylulose-5-phosphate reductoisomerase, partial [Oscillospiraceae bacterium]|nr:1-deoxy-D-xylulose-5-phosphate reductoisomerase [Oscillospiraceae bacterium]